MQQNQKTVDQISVSEKNFGSQGVAKFYKIFFLTNIYTCINTGNNFLQSIFIQTQTIISYVILPSKYGFTIFLSHTLVKCLLSQFLNIQWRVPTLFITRYDPRSLACSLFIWPGDDIETLPPGLKTCFCDFLS